MARKVTPTKATSRKTTPGNATPGKKGKKKSKGEESAASPSLSFDAATSFDAVKKAALKILKNALSTQDWERVSEVITLLGGRPPRKPAPSRPGKRVETSQVDKSQVDKSQEDADSDEDSESFPANDALLAETLRLNRLVGPREREFREPYRPLEVICDNCRKPFRARSGMIPSQAEKRDDRPRILCNSCQVGGRRRG